MNVAVTVFETDDEESLQEFLPSQVEYAPEDDDFVEEEEQDAEVPENVTIQAETPPHLHLLKIKMQIHHLQREREPNAPQAAPEREPNGHQVLGPPPYPGKFTAFNFPRIPRSMLHL